MKDTAITMASELTEGELDFLVGFLKQKCLKGKHIEIGTAAGGTLCKILGAYNQENRPEFVVVDPMQYFPQQFDIVKKNLSQHNLSDNNIDFREMTSKKAYEISVKQNDRFDLVFIDGVHKIRYVTDDLKWCRLLNAGGYVLMHDYSDKHPGVQLAADRFMKQHPNYEKVVLSESLLVLRKTAASTRLETGFSDKVYAEIISPFLQLKRSFRKRFK